MSNGTVDLDEAETRRKLIEKINGVLAEVRAAEKRVRDAHEKHQRAINNSKAEVGTAERELTKLRCRYSELHASLLKRLPGVPADLADPGTSTEDRFG